jgi:hypothetical protein
MKFRLYRNGEVAGTYEPEELAAMAGFGEDDQVCPAQGENGETAWRRAAEFPEIAQALRAQPPAPPTFQPAPVSDAPDPADILNEASSKIFSHVTELMRELENRREERAFAQSLQRQVAELKGELSAARDRIAGLDGKAALIPGFEERERKSQELLAAARAEAKDRDRSIAELSRQLSNLNQELARARRSEASLGDDLKRSGRLQEELSASLAHKELALAKALGVIRKLEAMLGGLVPSASRPQEPPAAEAPPPPVPEAVAPPPARAEIPSPADAAWQSTITRIFRKADDTRSS